MNVRILNKIAPWAILALALSGCAQVSPYLDRVQAGIYNTIDKVEQAGVEINPTPDELPGDEHGS